MRFVEECDRRRSQQAKRGRIETKSGRQSLSSYLVHGSDAGKELKIIQRHQLSIVLYVGGVVFFALADLVRFCQSQRQW